MTVHTAGPSQPEADARREELIRQRLAGGRRGQRQGISPVSRASRLPVSFGQQRLWFLNMLEPESPEYQIPLVLRLRGQLDTAALNTAWQQLLVRHEILRTRYQLVDAEPVQVIDPPRPAQIPIIDLTNIPPVEREDRALELARNEVSNPFDLGLEQSVRSRLMRLAPDDHLLVVVFHHIACDGWSIGVFIRELFTLQMAAMDPAAALPALPIQYADFAAWQRDQLSGDRLARHLDYWRGQLDGLSPLELPTDRPRPPVRSWAGERVLFTVPAPLAAGLRDLADRQDTTLFTVGVTAFQVLLARYTGQRDVAVGSAVSGRNRPEVQDLIGFFLNTVVLRARWAGDPSFVELLDGNRQIVLDALHHQDAPVQFLVDDIDKDRDRSRTPLFQVMFDLAEAPPASFTVPELQVESVDVVGAVAKHDLRLELTQLPDGTLRGVLEYPTALFDPATIDRMAGHFLRLLQSIVDDPVRPLSALDLLPPAQRDSLLAAATGVDRSYPWRPVTAALAEHATTRPHAPAVITADGQLSYAQLDARANQIAHHLRQRGIGPGSTVGVCLGRGPELLPALLGVWRCGAAYVPMDPTDPEERLAYIVDDAAAAVIVTESAYADRLIGNMGAVPVLVDTERALIDAQPTDDPGLPLDPDEPAYLIYTSGSTGRPKGVQVTHGGLANYLAWAASAYLHPNGNGAPLFSSIAFDLVVTTLYAPLVGGQPVHLLRQELEVADLGELLIDAAVAGPFSFIKLTPGHLDVVLHQLTAAEAGRLAGHLVVGGEGFAARLASRWWELAPGSGTTLVNEYGPTENTVANIAYFLDEPAQPITGELLPIGRPMANTTGYVLDEHLRPPPVGVVGDLYLGGAQLARGYRNLPDLTAERFVPNPYGPAGTRLYRTGDRARVLAGGDIEFVGRADEQVKIRGYRVETAEVVAALVRYPVVRDAVVVVRDSGSGSRTLVGYVVVAQPDTFRPEPLRAFLEQHLPDYMIPTALVALDEIPLTSNGKTDYRALPDPDRASRQMDDDVVAPRTPLEEQVAAVWRRVLGIEQVGIRDNFFDLGGDSLSAVALVGDLRDVGLDLAVQDVFENPTVESLVELVGERPQAAQAKPGVSPFAMLSPQDRAKVPDDVEDVFPVSMLQAGMVYEMLGGGAVNYYHNATTYVIRDNAPLSPQALQAAANLLVARQEVLRIGFDVTTYSEPMQLIYRSAELLVGTSDLRHLSPQAQDEEVRRYMAAERARLFDISKPPLLRVFAHAREESTWSLTITECHPIMEGWSYHMLLMELLTYYRQIRDGQEPEPQVPLEIRFADFIAAERESLTAGTDRDYWRRALDGVTRFDLPTGWGDGPDAPPAPYRVEVMFTDLEADLRALAKTAEVPFKSVMHAAHLKVLSMLTDEPSFYNGLVCDTRPEVAGADRLYGLFLNTVPFPFRLTARTWKELVRDVFAQEVELWPHRRYPMPAIQRELTGGRRLIDVMFNYLDFRTVDMELVDFAASIDDSQIEFKLSATAFRQGVVNLRFHPDAVSRENGERLGAIYRLVLKAMAADPDGDAQATYLPAEERRRLIRDWNETAVERAPTTLLELFTEQVRAAPHAVAVIAADGERVSYQQLDHRANQLAHHLLAMGVGPEQFVGLCVEHSVELLVGLLGIVKAGAAYLPLDSDHPTERLAYALRDTGAGVVVTQDELQDVLPSFFGQVVCLDSDWAEIEQEPTQPPPINVDPDGVVYVIYTSGSTGQPKGVMVTHSGLTNYLSWAGESYCSEGRSGAPLLGSIAFDLTVTNLLVPLAAGRSVTLLPVGRDVEAVAELLARPGDFDLLKLTPAHLDVLRGLLPADAFVDSVGTFVVGGEQLPLETVAAWRKLAPGVRIINEYGPTETVVGCSVYEMPKDRELSAPISIGRPIANTQMYVLDRHLQPVPVGVVGELYIGGAGVARGYHDRPELTAERFIADPFSPVPGARLYRTGDLARFRPDGNLEFLDRADHQIKIRGYRIEPGEIEARLLAHPEVAEAVVVAQTDRAGDKRLVGYVVGASGREPQTSVLREFLRETLPDYMIPAMLVVLDALPRSTAGKIDRKALPAPEGARPDLTATYQPPRNATERRLAEIWQRVLGIEPIGVDDDLLDLGADSLSGLRVAAEANELGFAMSPMDAVAYPTVAELARHLLGGDRDDLVAEIARDAVLDPALRPSGTPAASADAPVLLTGATGFVGAFLLQALLNRTSNRVLCLVRAASDEEATRRLQAELERWQVFDAAAMGRVEVIAGDLAQPGFGLTPERFQELADTIGEIYHNGASVNAVYAYRSMRAVNVDGTREVLRLACTGPLKSVHHVSTLSVFGEETWDAGPVDEDTVQAAPPYPSNGYAQSKWAAEALVREAGRRGVPVRIFRMGKVSWHPGTGVFNPNDMVTRMVTGCIGVGASPEVSYAMTLTPVDYVAASIVDLARQSAAVGRAFHIVSQHRLRWRQAIEWIRAAGHPIELIDYDRWRARLVARSLEPGGEHLKPLALILPGEGDDFNPEEGLPDDYVPPTPTWLDRAGTGCGPIRQEDFAAFLARLTSTTG